jgi:hypothetical protein
MRPMSSSHLPQYGAAAEMIPELPQEVAGGQREAPGEMVVEDHRFPRLRSGHSLATGRATAHEIRGRKHSTLAQ